MKGIGITPEGTLLNPVNYDLFWEMAWESEAKDTETWLKEYITRRYGEYSQNSWEALLKFVLIYQQHHKYSTHYF